MLYWIDIWHALFSKSRGHVRVKNVGSIGIINQNLEESCVIGNSYFTNKYDYEQQIIDVFNILWNIYFCRKLAIFIT